MILIGISFNTHDSSISIFDNGKFKYYKGERLSGIKHDSTPLTYYGRLLSKLNIDLEDITAVAFVDPVTLMSNDQSYNAGPYDGSFVEKINYSRAVHPFNNKIESYLLDHHFAHYMSNTMASSKDILNAVISDQRGSNQHISLILGSRYCEGIREGNSLSHSTGRILSAIGEKMGIYGDESDVIGKVMGLQAYGNPIQEFVNSWTALEKDQTPLLINWIDTLQINASDKNQEWLDVVASVFKIAGIWQRRLFKIHPKNTPIIYSGGIAMNVNWNRELLDDGYDLKIEPHVYDGGLSIGCLRWLTEQYDIDLRIDNFPYIQGDESPTTKPSTSTINRVSQLLSDGKIVGWYQGHGELGPRALGNRSILMRPDIPNGKDILNQKVKHREWWRPFGASVKQDKASEYFDLDNSPYMLYTAKVLRDELPSITHVDGTCRHQTVTPEQNALFYDLLDAFENKTGLPVLLNTSLNVGGKPIAGKIEEAIELFKTSDMDALCVGDDLYVK